MNLPPYIRGLGDLFSTGKRVAIALGTLGLAIALISATSSFSSHVNDYNYSGPLITGNIWLYIGIFLIILAFLAFIGDVRYSARQQEIDGQRRLRSAEDKLAESLDRGAADKKESGSVTPDRTESVLVIRDRASKDDALALSVLWELTNARLSEYHRIATRQARRSFATAQKRNSRWVSSANRVCYIVFPD